MYPPLLPALVPFFLPRCYLFAATGFPGGDNSIGNRKGNRMRRAVKRWAFTGAGVVLAGGLMAAPAFAQTDGGTPVNGTITVPGSLTMSLTNPTFAITLDSTGTGSSFPGAMPVNNTDPTVTVTTNDGTGYTITEAVTSDSGKGFPGAIAGDEIAASSIRPFGWSGPGESNGGLAPAFDNAGGSSTVVDSKKESATGGDAYALGWELNNVTVPADVYTGTINVTALAGG